MIRCDRTAAWAALQGHFEAHGCRFDLRDAFARDAGRFDALGFEAPGVFADLSKNYLIKKSESEKNQMLLTQVSTYLRLVYGSLISLLLSSQV